MIIQDHRTRSSVLVLGQLYLKLRSPHLTLVNRAERLRLSETVFQGITVATSGSCRPAPEMCSAQMRTCSAKTIATIGIAYCAGDMVRGWPEYSSPFPASPRQSNQTWPDDKGSNCTDHKSLGVCFHRLISGLRTSRLEEFSHMYEPACALPPT